VKKRRTPDAASHAALPWALRHHRLRAGAAATYAVAAFLGAVAAAAPRSRLNLLLTDGEQVVATAWTHSLSVRTEPDAVMVASEPVDKLPGWLAVPDGHLLTAVPGRASTRPLSLRGTGTR